MPHYSGSCLCGKITFELVCEFKAFYLCHCSRCRKKTGSAHASNLFTKAESFTWLTGVDSVKHFNVPSTRFETAFCTNCGSTMPTVNPNGRIMVPAGSLDGDLSIRPDSHIFMGSRADWDQDFASIPCHETFPG